MSRVNPLYILALLLFVSLYLFYQNMQKERELHNANQEYITLNSQAIEFSELSQKYGKEYVESEILSLKEQYNIQVNQMQNRVALVVANNKLSQEVLTKVLNSYLKILSITIEDGSMIIEVENR